MIDISIVSPVYKGESMLEELVSRTTSSITTITDKYEIVLVNDCSPDNSWNAIKSICNRDKHVIGVNLSRNFGQHYAITAGLTITKGKWVVVMDCDLQDRPEEIKNLYNKAQDGYDCVFAQRTERQDNIIRKLQSAMFHSAYTYMTGIKYDKSVGNFGIYNRKVINAVLSMGDAIKSFGPMVDWVGYNRAYQPVKHAARAEGKSSFNLVKLIRQASDGIIGFSNKPLYMVMEFGFFICGLSLLIALIYLLKYLVGGVSVDGFTTIVISLWLLGGIIIMLIGVVGIYIAKIFDRVKQRPSFIIKETLNIEE